ncbi:MAG: 1-acyl-sn-glycerol-3-phosphate acyltransferase [Clostridiales bacterium]|nr:1-acyl-sn-glycerol-3-phosphate acyltransferase [Clostridiales bacterium]
MVIKGAKRHDFVYRFLYHTFPFFIKRLFNYKWEKADFEGPYIVISNHTLNLDPVVVGLSFKKSMYFVMSEHMLRKGFVSKCLKYLVNPIVRLKGTTAASTALEIMRRLKSGYNVCLFAEGNRSYNGITGSVLESTGKMVKASGAALVTYRVQGGYLSSPRWSRSLRKGKVTGAPVNYYSPAQLKAMSVDEVNAAIKNDIYENAYATQEKEMIRFKGKRLAEGITSAIYYCPRCNSLDSFEVIDSTVRCKSCSYEVKYNEYGYFEGDNVVFDNVLAWDEWQLSRLEELWMGNTEDNVLFSDNGVSLMSVMKGHKTQKVADGDLIARNTYIECAGRVFDFAGIADMQIHSQNTIVFSHKGENYEIRVPKNMCTRKYMEIYSFWRNKQ